MGSRWIKTSGIYYRIYQKVYQMRATRLIGELTKTVKFLRYQDASVIIGLFIMFKPRTSQIDQNQLSKT